MSIEQIQGEEYTVEYDNAAQTIAFRGTIRLQISEDYQPITELLQRAHESAQGTQLVLDFLQLQFLNSSGISMISKFVISARKQNQLDLVVLGNRDVYWQQKSLANLQKLWPKVLVDFV